MVNRPLAPGALLRPDDLSASTVPAAYPARPLCKLKTASGRTRNQPATRWPRAHSASARSDGGHRWRHLAVRRLADTGVGSRRRVRRPLAGRLAAFDRRHTPLPFVHRGRSPARRWRACSSSCGRAAGRSAPTSICPICSGCRRSCRSCASTRAVGRSNAHWKLDAIDAYAGGRALAWIDDALNDACREWARRAPRAHAARADRARRSG